MLAGSQRSSRRPADNPARASSPATSRCTAQVQAITTPRVSCQRPSAAAPQRAAPARTEHRAGVGVRTRRAADRHVAPQYCRRRPPPARGGSGVPQCAHRPPSPSTPPAPSPRPFLLNRAKHSTARFSRDGEPGLCGLTTQTIACRNSHGPPRGHIELQQSRRATLHLAVRTRAPGRSQHALSCGNPEGGKAGCGA